MKPGSRGLLGLALAAPLLLASARVEAHGFEGLRPGKFVVRDQAVPVRLVFIGYERTEIDEAALRAVLPQTYAPVVRYPRFYGLNGRDTGLNFRFDYRFVYKNRRFEDEFFAFLASHGTAGPLTAFQQAYNDQANNVVDVTGPVLYIDGPSVERYLAGGDVQDERGYTIFFVNWWGRRDFKFHVYTKTDEPDPDTGYNFGALRGSRKIIAWGGSSSRSWFYDLSAGPESWTNNYVVDDDQSNYHMPPVWEYRGGGYRPPEQLSSDLGLVARFVGIDLLFTTSPLYDPLITAPDVDGSKVAHVAMLEDDPTSSGLPFFKKEVALEKWRSFEPYYRWKVAVGDKNPIDAGAERALGIWSGNLIEDDCWNAYGDPFAELFCYAAANRSTYIPAYRPKDYVGGIFSFNTTSASLGGEFGLLGYADDNWMDGVQSFVFAFDTADYRDLGYGFTTTLTHEFGHHVGMSHPHDGYDSEADIDFGPDGPFEFAWSGDESNTVMHYLDLSGGFGRFDRDNMYRWETAGYLNWSNALAGDILASSKAFKVSDLVEQADGQAARAIREFKEWDYLEAATAAREAYSTLATAARRLGVATPTMDAAFRRLPNARPLKDGCRIRNPDN